MTRTALKTGRYLGSSLRKAYTKWKGKSARSAPPRRRRGGKTGVIQAGVNGVSFSSVRRKTRMYPSVRKYLVGKMSYSRVVDTARKEWDAGAQAVVALPYLDSTAVGKLFTSYSLSAVGVGDAQIAIKNCTSRVNITNQSNSNLVCTIYDVINRHDVVSGSDAQSPEDAWTNGLAQITSGTGSTGTTPQTMGVTPFQSYDFCKNYRVIKVTKIYMELGKSHIHNINLMTAFKMNTRDLDDSGAATKGFRNITMHCMLVFHGMPVNDGTTDTLIAMGSGAVDIVSESKIVWKYNVAETTRSMYFDDNQGTITTEKLMNEQTGAADTYEEA